MSLWSFCKKKKSSNISLTISNSSLVSLCLSRTHPHLSVVHSHAHLLLSLSCMLLHPPGGPAFLHVRWYTEYNRDKRLAHANWPGWFLLGLESLKTWKGIEYQQCSSLPNRGIFVFIGELPSTSSPDLPGHGVNWAGRKHYFPKNRRRLSFL